MVDYRILYADGRDVAGSVDLPPADSSGQIGKPSDNMRKRWDMVREIAQGVVGEDNEPEHVTIWLDGKYVDMFVDETGVLKELPFNAQASAFYRANWLAHEPNPGPEDELPPICGDAVLFLEKVW